MTTVGLRSATAAAARPAPGHPLGPNSVAVSSAVLDEAGVTVGQPIALRSPLGRIATVDVAVDPEDDDGARYVRLGRLLWTQLEVRPGDCITVQPVDVPLAERVVLTPAFHLSTYLEGSVAQSARRLHAIVWPGGRLFLPVFSGDRGIIVRVEGDGDSPLRIDSSTEIEFGDPDPDLGRRSVTFAEVGGLAKEIARLRTCLELPLLRPAAYQALGVTAPRGIILHGPPGTGKTLLSRAVANDLGVAAMKMSATDLVGTYSGETEAKLRSLFTEALNHAPTLIVIDEIDVLTTSRRHLGSQSDIRATTQLLELMDGIQEVDGVAVLGTTNRIEAVDEAFRRPGRFDEELYIGVPDAEGRKEILAVHTRHMPLTGEAEKALDSIADARLGGLTGADLLRVAREIGLAAAARLGREAIGVELADTLAEREIMILEEDVEVGTTRVAPSALRQLPSHVSPMPWEDIKGLDDVKEQLYSAADAAIAGAPEAQGVLLTGPPGNGKSLLVGSLAMHLHVNFLQVDGSSIFTQWLGESEAALRSVFEKARQVAPAILAIEHLDAIAPSRTDRLTEAGGRRVLAALLSSLDKIQQEGGVAVIGVTDQEELVDDAVKRTGRLGIRIEVSEPDEDRRREIVAWSWDCGVDEPRVIDLAAETAGASAAEVRRRAQALLERPTDSGLG